jgi:PAS domain
MHSVADHRLDRLYRYWAGQRKGRPMPSRAEIDPLEIPAEIWPNTMLLDVLWQHGLPRFRYRRVGDVFWRASGQEPTGRFVDEVLPETAGYRAYIIGVYSEMATRRRAMYTENIFTLDNGAAPMLVKRVSLPLSTDGNTVDMALAGHVFAHETLPRENALSLVSDISEIERVVLET